LKNVDTPVGSAFPVKIGFDTNLLQLFAHPEIPEWFSAIAVTVFDVNIVLTRNKHNW